MSDCNWSYFSLYLLVSSLLALICQTVCTADVIDAINAGGSEHVDIHGIHYRADPLEGKSGTASDFGRRMIIQRVPPHDQILYQTERYSLSDFEYRFAIEHDGDYVLVFKFCEVYFNGPEQKVYLDIFARVGRGTAYDEVVPFTVKKGKLKINEEFTDFAGELVVKFKKVNALLLIKGSIEDVPPLLPLDLPQDDDELPHEQPADESDILTRLKHASGPKQPNPYAAQDQSTILLPILIAAACFIPAVFCLCKI